MGLTYGCLLMRNIVCVLVQIVFIFVNTASKTALTLSIVTVAVTMFVDSVSACTALDSHLWANQGQPKVFGPTPKNAD